MKLLPPNLLNRIAVCCGFPMHTHTHTHSHTQRRCWPCGFIPDLSRGWRAEWKRRRRRRWRFNDGSCLLCADCFTLEPIISRLSQQDSSFQGLRPHLPFISFPSSFYSAHPHSHVIFFVIFASNSDCIVCPPPKWENVATPQLFNFELINIGDIKMRWSSCACQRAANRLSKK